MDDSDLTPKQQRSRETKRRILDATLALLEDRHFEDLTIADIAQVAGMAVGNFYKRFKNKADLLPHLYSEYNRRFNSFAKKIQSKPDNEPWHQIVHGVVNFFFANKGLIRALHLHSRFNPKLVPDGNTDSRSQLYEALELLIDRPGMDSKTRKLRGRLVAVVMISTTTEAILYPDMTPAVASGIKKNQLIKELALVLRSYADQPW